MANTTLEEKRIWRSSAYWVPVLLAAFAAHAQSFSVYTPSNDDMWAEADFHLMLTRQGRPLCELLSFLFNPAGFIPQAFRNVSGIIVYVFALTVLCDFWKRLGKDRLSDLSLGFFAALFVSCPLTHEMLLFGGSGISAVCALLCAGALWLCWLFAAKRQIKYLLGSVLCLALMINTYEAFVPVYICAVIGTMWLEWQWDPAAGGGIGRQLQKAVPYIVALCAGMVLSTLIGNAVLFVLEGSFIPFYGRPNSVSWGGPNENIFRHLYILLKDILLQYGIFAVEYWPLALPLVSFGACFLFAAVETGRKKSLCPLFFWLAMVFGVFSISFAMGRAEPYRVGCWPIAFYTGFAGMQCLSAFQTHKNLQKGMLALVGYFVLLQCQVMAYRIHLEELRWQSERTLLEGIAVQYEMEFGKEKPLVLVGHNKLDDMFFDANYLNEATWLLPFLEKYYPDLHVEQRQKYFCRIAQQEQVSVIGWALDIKEYWGAEANSNCLRNLFSYCGCDVPIGTRKMLEEAAPLKDTLPAWPQKGSMIDAGEYIVANLGEEFLEGY